MKETEASKILNKVKDEFMEEHEHSREIHRKSIDKMKEMLKQNKLNYLLIPFFGFVLAYDILVYLLSDIFNALLFGFQKRDEEEEEKDDEE